MAQALDRRWRPGRRARAGFTLIEILLVMAIVAVIASVAMPSFVRSIRGQRLGAGGRTMATVARYARSLAVLKQADLVLVFNLANGQVDVVASNVALPPFSRSIEGIRIQAVAVEGQDEIRDGTCRVPFFRHGLCVPFTVTLGDDAGNTIALSVDALGSVRSTRRSSL